MFKFTSIHRLLFVWINSFAPFFWMALLTFFFDQQRAKQQGGLEGSNELVLNIAANGYLTTGLLSILGIFCWAIIYREKEPILSYLMPIITHVLMFMLIA